MTRRQRQVLDAIAKFIVERGHSPSFDELAEILGLSSLATVHKHIHNLKLKGLLTVEYNRSRSIKLTGKCPYCGRTQRKTKAVAPTQEVA